MRKIFFYKSAHKSDREIVMATLIKCYKKAIHHFIIKKRLSEKNKMIWEGENWQHSFSFIYEESSFDSPIQNVSGENKYMSWFEWALNKKNNKIKELWTIRNEWNEWITIY